MFNFKRYLFDFLKTTFILLSVFLFWWSLYFVLALNFPNQVPSWESPWWIYTDYFNKIFQDCWNWNVLQWYDSSKNKVCVWILSWIPVPVNWSCWSWRWVCNSWTLSWINNTSSCWTTATWSCIWSNWWTNSSCSYGNPSCPIPVNWSCWSSSWVCDSWNMTWINNTSTCWTTATWSCTWYNWWTSVNCSKANSACSSNWVCWLSKWTCSSWTLSWIDNTSSCWTTAMRTCSWTNWWSMATCWYNNWECPINWSCWGSRWTCNTGSMAWIDNTSSCWTTATWKCDWLYWWTTVNCSQYNWACAWPPPPPLENWSCWSWSAWSCSWWNTSWINYNTNCWQTSTWKCSWISWWSDSWTCSYTQPTCTYRTIVWSEQVDRINWDCPTDYSYIWECSTKWERVSSRPTAAFYWTNKCLATVYECK